MVIDGASDSDARLRTTRAIRTDAARGDLDVSAVMTPRRTRLDHHRNVDAVNPRPRA
jgi:hypothetical protein